jgi:hypothetical protein
MLMRPPASLIQDKGLVISKDELIDAFGDFFVFEAAVNCPKGDCLVGHLKSGRNGFLEIITNGKQVTKVRLAMQVGQPNDKEFFTDKALENKDRAMESELDLAVAIALAYGQAPRDGAGQKAAAGFIKWFSEKLSSQKTSCGIASFNEDFEGMGIWEYSMNSNGWYVLIGGPR